MYFQGFFSKIYASRQQCCLQSPNADFGIDQRGQTIVALELPEDFLRM
jgi:hypothetical protein